MKVAIIGTGMAGLVAAHAAYSYWETELDEEIELVLYGANGKAPKAGARFYERMIPGTNAQMVIVKTESIGDADDYATKVGGPITRYNRPRPEFVAHDYYGTYSTLFDLYRDSMMPMEMDFKTIQESQWADCDYVFNTSPRPNFYSKEEHGMFGATRHWRLDESLEDEDGVKSPFTLPSENASKNLVIFDASADTGWFKISQIFGLMSVEWGFDKKPPIAGVHLEILPLGVPENMGLRNLIPGWRETTALAHVGAVARWEPSTDIGEVFYQVTDILSGKVEDDNDSGGSN